MNSVQRDVVSSGQYPPVNFYVPVNTKKKVNIKRKIAGFVLVTASLAFVISLGLFMFYTVEQIHLLENEVQNLQSGVKDIRKLGAEIVGRMVKPQPDKLQDVSTCSLISLY